MKRKATALAAASATVAFGLSACTLPVLEVQDTQSSGQSGQQSAQSGPQSGEAGDIVLTDEQVDRIVAGVQAVIDQSDADKSVEPLEQRLVNPALSMRKGQLVRADKTDTDLAPLIIGDDVHSATAGTAFPRVLVVASQATEDEPSEVFFLTQQDAKADYMLENWARLLGGTPVKGVAVRDGSTVLAPDYDGLKVSPEQVVATYVNHLNSPDNDEYKIFDDNVFGVRYAEELKALTDAVQVAGTVTAEAKLGDAPVTAVLLDTGSALVASSFTYTHTYSKTVEGATLELGGTPAAYVDDPAVESPVTVSYQVNVFFVVPPKGDDAEVAVVGAERVIQSVTKTD